MSQVLPPIHPGEILREEFMIPMGISINGLARDLRVPVTRIAEIFHERRGITSDTALRLSQYFETTAAFWMNLQSAYDLEVAKRDLLGSIQRDVQPRRMPAAG
jgi:addiction module HigA family antidote